MTLPGTTVTVGQSPPPRSIPTDTGVAYAVVKTERGLSTGLVTAAKGLRNMDDWVRENGSRLSSSVDYDWAEEFFRDGGNLLVTSRAVGPSPTYATLALTGTGTTLNVTAKDPGAWPATHRKIQVIQGPIGGAGTRVIIVLDENGVELERTAEFATQADGALQVLSNVTITVGGGSGLPAVLAATFLSGGNDDAGNITQTQVDAALARFDVGLGPGQVVSPNWQTDAAHVSLLLHAKNYNRYAICDPVDTTVKATLLSSAAAMRAAANADYGELWAPWITIPGLATGSTGRSIPPSAAVCARMAATDAEVSPNQAAAGRWGVLSYATSVKATFSRVAISGVIDAEDLNNAGVNLIVLKDGQIKLYGNRTTVDPAGVLNDFIQGSNTRYRMWTIARAKVIGEDEMFARINRLSIEQFHSACVGLLLGDYINKDLFGDLDDDRPETAFNVVTDEPINTASTIQAGQLNASLTVRPTRGAETVNFTITAVALTEPVA